MVDFVQSAFLLPAPCPDLQTSMPNTRIFYLESMSASSRVLPPTLIPTRGTLSGGLWISAAQWNGDVNHLWNLRSYDSHIKKR